MGLYKRTMTATGSPDEYTERLDLIEHSLYGSSRLGLDAATKLVSERTLTGSAVGNDWTETSTESAVVSTTSNLVSERMGEKTYELADYLGNVLVVVSDRKLALGGLYYADIESANRYYPFGMTMPGMTYQSDNYRYGFQGQEHDPETGLVNYKYRMHDPRIGRFFALDPLRQQYPHNSPYAFSENRVIDGIDFEGLGFEQFRYLWYKYLGDGWGFNWTQDGNSNYTESFVKDKAKETYTYAKHETIEALKKSPAMAVMAGIVLLPAVIEAAGSVAVVGGVSLVYEWVTITATRAIVFMELALHHPKVYPGLFALYGFVQKSLDVNSGSSIDPETKLDQVENVFKQVTKYIENLTQEEIDQIDNDFKSLDDFIKMKENLAKTQEDLDNYIKAESDNTTTDVIDTVVVE